MTREEIIKQNYEYVTHRSNGKVLIRIFKPRTMGDLPVDIIWSHAEPHHLHPGTWQRGKNWGRLNPDYGILDAQIVTCLHGMICDYYVCSLLIRPNSQEAYDWYGQHMNLEPTERLKLMWDSREYDKEHKYQAKYTITNNEKVPLWRMDGKRLNDIEGRLTKEQIMERAKMLRPIGEPSSSGLRYWVDGGNIHTSSYTWNLKPLTPTGHLTELGTIVTYHKSSPFFAKPSVDECVYQCPFNDATAFMITGIGSYNGELDRLECETTYFKGNIPAEIRNREIEW